MSFSAEQAHRAASDAEQVVCVDEADRPLCSVTRAELRARGLIGRACFVLLFNSAGDLCVHRRSLSKALYPGYWDVAAGGMLGADEDYAEGAARELEEELGVAGVSLRDHGRFFFDHPGNRIWAAVFSAVWDGALRLQPEEVIEARFIDQRQVLAELREKPYCPDSLEAFELCRGV